VTVPAAPEPRLQRWSEDEVAAVVRKCLELDTQAARYVLVALGKGLRTEELLGLGWSDVGLDDRLVVVRTVAPPGGAKELREGGKTDGASRVVSIDGITAGALQRQREHVEGLRRRRAELNGERVVKGKAPLGWADLDLVLVTSVWTILDRKTLRKDFDEIQK
jgi:integrase